MIDAEDQVWARVVLHVDVTTRPDLQQALNEGELTEIDSVRVALAECPWEVHDALTWDG